MDRIVVIVSMLLSISAFAGEKKNEHHVKEESREVGEKHHPAPLSIFDVIPLNSPVKESVARFLLKVPNGFDVDEVRYKIQNSNHRFVKNMNYERITLVNGTNGKEIDVPISKLSPGFYQLFVKIKDKKRKEHDYKSKYKDHAMFVIDQSLEVKMPDPKVNNATLLGVDSDNDGIRDDVQRWVNENFLTKPNTIIALKQLAIEIQNSLASKDDKNKSIQATFSVLRSQDCVSEIAYEEGFSYKEIIENNQKLRAIYMNTADRIRAKLLISNHFNGQLVKDLSKEEACNF